MTNTDDSNIRDFGPADRDDLFDAFRLNVPVYFAAEEEQKLVRFIAHERQYFLVMEVDDKVVGCCGYMLDGITQEGKLTWVFFHPAYQGMGFGQKLVGHCMQQIARNKNINQVIVRTSQLAGRFFEKLGFELIHKEKDYWGKGLDLHYMVRSWV